MHSAVQRLHLQAIMQHFSHNDLLIGHGQVELKVLNGVLLVDADGFLRCRMLLDDQVEQLAHLRVC